MAMPAWKKVCCAVDFSEESRFAMEEAAALAGRAEGELTLVHVVGARPKHGAGVPRGVPAAETGRAGQRLEEWREAAEALARTRVSASLLTGVAAEQIVAFARECRCDLVVLGTPGMLGCERIGFGSVAEGVIRRAPCSVVVARRPTAPRS
jgi:nucleotide-binding universal stress UspA family protein